MQLNRLQYTQNAFANALWQLPGPPIRIIFSNHCTGSRYRNALNTKSFPLHISSSSLLLHVTCTISSQSSLLDPLDHPHWSLFSNHQLTPVARSQTAPSRMPTDLICCTIISPYLLTPVLLQFQLHNEFVYCKVLWVCDKDVSGIDIVFDEAPQYLYGTSFSLR